MKRILVTAIIFICSLVSSAQNQLVIDLHKLVNEKAIQVYNRELKTITDGSRTGINLSREDGEGVAWLNGIQFSNGTIEFDVRGEDVKQHSFVGLAFHGQDDSTFDAVYFRPFQFKEKEEPLKNRRIQYISLPDYPWRTLREQFPGKYENTVEPSPDPNAWFRVRIVINGSTVSTYVNGSKEPAMVIEKITKTRTGKLGLYAGDTSGGDFANVVITKTN